MLWLTFCSRLWQCVSVLPHSVAESWSNARHSSREWPTALVESLVMTNAAADFLLTSLAMCQCTPSTRSLSRGVMRDILAEMYSQHSVAESWSNARHSSREWPTALVESLVMTNAAADFLLTSLAMCQCTPSTRSVAKGPTKSQNMPAADCLE
ncbi:hypothetical protein J6590_056889 [Homalodisca vitripennis]|nr:hypothetical protein J6590_056889 [Homalodisca vitripennis]